MRMFELSPGELAKIAEWSAEQDAIVVARQQQLVGTGSRPNYGAIGGEITYMFTPTGLGVITKVQHGITHSVLDVTEYENW